MTPSRAFLAGFPLALLTIQLALADGLQVGAPAPAMRVAEWAQGDPIELSACVGKSVCVIDLWATWCPPCLFAAVERSALQEELADSGVIFIGVTNESPETVRAVLAEYPRELNWRVACDDDGKTLSAYSDTAEGRRLPFAVVVDRDGRVAWYGDPRDGLTEVVRQVRDGKWSLDRARRAIDNRTVVAARTREIDEALQTGDCAGLVASAKALAKLVLDPGDSRARAARLSRAALFLLRHEDCRSEHGPAALALAQAAMHDCGGDDGTVVSIYARALFETGDSDNAIRQQERALKLAIGPGQTAEMASALRRFRAADGDPTVPAVQSQAANPDTGGSRGLSQVRAIGDLQHLHDLLRLNYAGYDDLEWRLRCDGSSWSQRTDRFVDELRSRPNWPAGDFYALVRRYLEPVQDTHFWTQGPASLLGLFKPPVDRYVTPFTPYFTDLRLRADGDGFRVISAPKELGHVDGLELRAVGVVSNHRAALAQPYLFPTVSVLGEDEEFLLGCFSDRPSPAPLKLEFHGTGNPPVSVTLSLHRSQATVGSFVMPSWTLRRPPQVAYPTLTVRTMDRQILAGLPETAGPLSKEPVIVIDLRGNDGGSDEPAMNWCAGFSKQRYRFGPGADLQRGVAEGRDRWTCGFGGSWDETRMGVNAAKQPYAGQLFILIDKGTASSGETFAAFASQIPGAILLGENSAGCTLYGNCDIQEKLPASGITIRFGRTKFLDGAVRPTREGVGFFPDYWLDERDPYAAIQRLLTSRKKGPN